ncbi:POL4 protein, partial [Pseudoatta argentina]
RRTVPPPIYEELQELVAQLQAAPQQSNVARMDSYRVPKIPPFLIKDSVIWFIQVEATVETARITDQKTRAHYVIMSLDAEAIACCRDLIAEPDESESYTKLKQRIIENVSASAESQLRQLIKGQVLTSGKPSQILSRLRNLNTDKRCDDAVLKTVFFEHLSPHIRDILAISECADLDFVRGPTNPRVNGQSPRDVLFPDLKGRRLIDSQNNVYVSGIIKSVPQLAISTVNPSTKFASILSEFPEITGLEQATPNCSSDVCHHIITTGPPVSERPTRLNPVKAAKAKFQQLIEAGICHPICGNYRRLNAITVSNKFPVPHLHGCSSNLRGKRQIFRALGDLEFVFAFIDDILIASTSLKDHEAQLRIVLQRLKKFYLRLNRRRRLRKCLISAKRVWPTRLDAAETRIVCDASYFAIGAALKQRLDDSHHPETTVVHLQFTTRIEYLSGNDNIVADSLSRIEAIRLPTEIKLNELAQQQEQDRNYGLSANLLNFLTDLIRLIRQRYVWPNIHRDIVKWYKDCLDCQQSKITRHVQLNLEKFIAPDGRYEHVHMDLIGPLSKSDGYKYCIDRFSRWPVAIPLKDTEAITVAQFYDNWVANFGAPKTLTTDQASCTSSADRQRIRTTAYHPASNDMIERWHRSLKAAIMCHANNGWSRILSTVLLDLRTHIRFDIGAFLAEFVYGTMLRVPEEFVLPDDFTPNPKMFIEEFREHMRKVKPISVEHKHKKRAFVFKDLYSCSHIFLRVGGTKER